MTTTSAPSAAALRVDPLDGLNPAQRAAAAATTGPVCILAGAGTGKTRTVTHRIANQLATGVARPAQVLAVTFTDKAATELRERLHALGVPPVRAATFHAAAWAQLRHFWPRVTALGLAGADGDGLPEVLSSKLRLLVPAGRRLRVEARDLASEIEWAKARMIAPQGYAEAAADRPTPVAAERMAQVYADYEAAKRAAGAIDYEDMLLLTAELLTRDEVAAAEVRDRYRYLTVDEYQDVNPTQQALLEAWLGDGDELCVVGDDDQTIYSFTGASSAHLTGFEDRWPHGRVVALTRNYRSTAQVLDLANRVLWTKPAPTRKRLTAALPASPDDPDPVFREFPDADAEVAAVAARCAALVAGGLPPREIAVLYRVNAQSEPFEAALREVGVPSAVRGDGGFFSRPEVRQALRLLAADRERGDRLDPGDLLAAVGEQPVPPDRRVERVLREGLDYDGRREPAGAVARERWRNLGALVAAAARQVAADPHVSYGRVVDDLLTRASSGATAPDEGGAVTLTTLHGAKGMEFTAVFLVSLERGLLPISHAKQDAEVEEERRLLYVGVTRARRHLWLSWARERPARTGRLQKRTPSPFLYGLGDGAPTAKGGAKPPRAGGTAAALDDLEGDAAARAERLRAWRAERCKADGVPAYVVFDNKTLAALALAEPATPGDLLEIPGIGPAKVDRYGDDVLAVLAGG
jgi:DNA helicase-2/ATP-dependent DNA helicase PcrA